MDLRRNICRIKKVVRNPNRISKDFTGGRRGRPRGDIMIKKEYRNVKEYQHDKWSSKTYDVELWIDGKYIQRATLSEADYKYNVLMIRLEEYIQLGIKMDRETLEEIKEVIQLRYKEGTIDGSTYDNSY